jgi:predicted exporter
MDPTKVRDQLATGLLTHAALNRALTAGFSSSLRGAGLFAIAGFAAALVAVRHHQVPEAAILEHDIAA